MWRRSISKLNSKRSLYILTRKGARPSTAAPIELGAAEGIISAVEAGWGISWVSMVAAQRAFEMGKIRLVEVEGMNLPS